MNARINISVPREIHTAARVYAVQRGKTLAQVVIEALRRLLDDEQRRAPTPP